MCPASVYQLLIHTAGRIPKGDLFVIPRRLVEPWELTQTRFSYRDTVREVDRLADLYRSAGYGRGHRIALLAENRPAFFFHYLALNAVGASVVPVNPDYTSDELRYLLTHSECALVVAIESRVHTIAPLAHEGGIPVTSSEATSFPMAIRPPPTAPLGEDTECALLYTSGTTSRPKGCIISNGYMLGWSEWYEAQRGFIDLCFGAERLLQPLPTFHINGIGNSFMGMLATGGAQVLIDRFHPKSWWQEAIETRATCFHYLGVMPAMLLNLPASPDDRAHTLRYGMGGGVHPTHHQPFETRFGVPLLEGWAMTETGGGGILCAMEEPRHRGMRCIGRADRAGPPVEIRVVDDAGVDVAPETPGELLVRARGTDPRRRFFSGYLKDPDATAAIWADNWLHTGDVVRQSTDGSVFFMDRKKNIIRRSGENIAAIEVESTLVTHAAVHQCAVIATDDPIRGEEVLAAIVLAPNVLPEKSLAELLLNHCRKSLAYYKLPGYIVFVDRLPTTSTQKVRKHDLGPLAERPMDHPGCHDLRVRKRRAREPG
ncbi:MAG: AMP-binding protein [Burkholderiales bacterium]